MSNDSEMKVVATEIANEIVNQCSEREKNTLDSYFQRIVLMFENTGKDISSIKGNVDSIREDIKDSKKDIGTTKDSIIALEKFQTKTEERLKRGSDRFTEIEKSSKSAHKRISTVTRKIAAVMVGSGIAYAIIQFYEFLHK